MDYTASSLLFFFAKLLHAKPNYKHASGEAACREKQGRKQSHHGPVNDLSTAVQLTNRLLLFWAEGGFVYYKRVSSPSFLVTSQSLNNNIVVCNRAG